MATFNNRVETTTREEYMPELVDTVLNSNVLATNILKGAKKFKSGRMKFPIKTSKNNTGGSFSGFDTFSTSASDTRNNLEFSPRFYQITVSLPLDEISINNTEGKVLDLIDTEVKSSAQDMADDIGSLFYDDGTGNSNKDFLGLGALVDDGTNVATIGGLSRSTFPTLQSTVTASGGTLTLQKMRQLYNDVRSGNVRPTTGYTTEEVYSFYENLLTSQERYDKTSGDARRGLVGGTGYEELFFKTTPIHPDEKCDSGTLFFLNENFLDWMALPMQMTEPVPYKAVDIEGNDYSDVLGLGFSWSGWIKPTNSAAVVGHIYLGGNFITTNPKRHGKLTGITGV